MDINIMVKYIDVGQRDLFYKKRMIITSVSYTHLDVYKRQVGSYFANPFGPVQRQDQCEPLLQDYFQRMFDQGVKVGQLRTRLGIKGNEHNGPKEAATEILKYITGEKELKMLEDDE